MASTFAGIGFGNAGVHLCHAMSYPISGNMNTFFAKGYPEKHGVVVSGTCDARGESRFLLG